MPLDRPNHEAPRFAQSTDRNFIEQELWMSREKYGPSMPETPPTFAETLEWQHEATLLAQMEMEGVATPGQVLEAMRRE